MTIRPELLEGVSDEVRALVAFLEASRVPHRVTTTINHKATTSAGYPSRHVAAGTNGKGLAIDVAGPAPSRDSQALGDIYRTLATERHSLHELIYAGPQTTTNVKNGQLVAKYAQNDHHDHVHVSVDKGVLLVAPHPPTISTYWWLEDAMPVFKDPTDEERAFVRTLYLKYLLRQPESFEAVEWWRLELQAKGADFVIAQFIDLGEGADVLAKQRATFGVV